MEKDIAALPGYVRLALGRGDEAAALGAFREFAALCLAEGAKAGLVLSGPGDPMTPMGLRGALTALSRAGPRSGFKLALVARTAGAQKIYRSAEAGAGSGGMKVRVFWNEYEAAAWLMGARQVRAR